MTPRKLSEDVSKQNGGIPRFFGNPKSDAGDDEDVPSRIFDIDEEAMVDLSVADDEDKVEDGTGVARILQEGEVVYPTSEEDDDEKEDEDGVGADEDEAKEDEDKADEDEDGATGDEDGGNEGEDEAKGDEDEAKVGPASRGASTGIDASDL